MSVYPLQVHIVRSSSPEAETTLTLSKRVRSWGRSAHLCGVSLRSPRVCAALLVYDCVESGRLSRLHAPVKLRLF